MFKFFVADRDMGSSAFFALDPGFGSWEGKIKNPSSRIQDKHPGSATQMTRVLRKGTFFYNLWI
jgi:hypothetical protein